MSNPEHEQAAVRPRLSLDHGSIPVGDVEEAVRFYRDTLGMEQLERPDFGFPGAWMRAGGVPVHLTTGAALRGRDAPLQPNEPHLAFTVDEGLDELVATLEQQGVPIWELTPSPAAERQVFILDPWGNMLELCTYGPPAEGNGL